MSGTGTGPYSPNTSSVKQKGAFLGRLTSEVRAAAWHLSADERGHILDVGCGNGLFFTCWGSAPHAKLIGLDLSWSLLQEARAVFQDNDMADVSLVQGDAFRLPFKRNSLNIVLFLSTLYNLESWEEVKRVLGEMMAACGPGGRMIFDIRNKGNPYIRLKYWWHRRKRTFATHAYGRKEIRRLLERNGFVVRREVPVGPVYCKAIPFAYVIEAERTSSP